jgi:hypothetical protein
MTASKSYRFWVPGQMPGLNEMIAAAKGCGGRGYRYATMKQQWTGLVALHARAARIPKVVSYLLALTWVEQINKNGARRDRDNVESAVKFVNDGLKLAKVTPDDGPDYYLGATHVHQDGQKPGVWIEVIPT